MLDKATDLLLDGILNVCFLLCCSCCKRLSSFGIENGAGSHVPWSLFSASCGWGTLLFWLLILPRAYKEQSSSPEFWFLVRLSKSRCEDGWCLKDTNVTSSTPSVSSTLLPPPQHAARICSVGDTFGVLLWLLLLPVLFDCWVELWSPTSEGHCSWDLSDIGDKTGNLEDARSGLIIELWCCLNSINELFATYWRLTILEEELPKPELLCSIRNRCDFGGVRSLDIWGTFISVLDEFWELIDPPPPIPLECKPSAATPLSAELMMLCMPSDVAVSYTHLTLPTKA